MALISLGDLRRRQSRDPEALEHYREAFTGSRAAGWVEAEAVAASNLAAVSRDRGQIRESAGYHERALELARQIGARHTEAVALADLGRTQWLLGRLPQALDLLDEALALCRELGAVAGEAAALNYLGDTLCAQGRLPEAAARLEEALTIVRQWQSRMPEGYLLCSLAAVHSDAGRLEQADAALDTAVAIGRDTREVRVLASAANVRAGVEHRRGRHAEALAQYRQTLALMRGTDDYAEVEALVGLAVEQHCLGGPDAARGDAEEALRSARRIGYGRLEAAAAEVARRVAGQTVSSTP
jgi:tetratricopeptide (TPR) repeat protein